MKKQGTTRMGQSAVAPLAALSSRILDHLHSFGPNVCVQREGDDAGVHAHSPSSVLGGVLRSPGRSLEAETRSFMEPRFGHDFSNVRIHTDEPSGDSARAIGADAYTVHNHIAFAPGRYAPETEDGKSLIAHELTHVVQQGPARADLGQPDRRFEVTSPSDSSERVADQISRGQLDARQAATLGHGARTGNGVQLIQRQKAQQAPSPTKDTAPPAPAEHQYSAGEAWLFAENRIVTELQTRYEELIRLGAFQTKGQIQDFFTPYDADLKADAPFSTFLNIAGGGAGNIPNDPSSIQPLQPGSPPSTPHGPIPQTFSVSGGVAGLLAASVGPLVSLILDASEVSGVRENLQTKVDQFLAEGLTTSSPTYAAFETLARSEMQQYFLSNWAETDRPHDASGLSALINETAQHTRDSYGLSSTVGVQVTTAVRDFVKQQLQLVQPVLDKLESAHRKKRIGAFALGGGILGGLIGGAIGFGLGGGRGLLAGALGGIITGGVVGLMAGGITNALTPSAAELRRKKAAEEAEEENRRKKRAPDILEPQYRPPRKTEFA